jgi:CTP synthase (UTP-ammonia lyase)
MSHVLKIAVIGDFNFTYNAHHATNLALDHAGRFLEIEVNYYWIKLAEATQFKTHQFQEYDGIWISPGPFKNIFFLSGIIDQVLQSKLPTFITGEGFKSLIEVLINRFNLNPNGEKLISDNLVEGDQFERVEIVPNSDALIKIYENHSAVELSSARYSLYPQLIHHLLDELIDIEGYNQFEEAEIVSLKKHPFFVACGFCPQISSTREIPHPLVYTFVKACAEKQNITVD